MRDFFYCLIFPHPRNNHRARFLHHRTILFLISFFIFSSLFFPSSFNPFSEKLKALADISVKELVDLTNTKRKENGLPALSSNAQLSNAAAQKADDMFAKNYWAHNSPDGTTPWFFIKESGYSYVYAGENLARGFNNANDVVNAWMASPAHRANVLSSNFKDVGFSVKSGKLNGEETFLVVQEFGSRSVIPAAKKSAPKRLQVNKVLGFNATPYMLSKPSFNLSSEFTMLLLLGLIFVFLADMIVIERKKIARFVGHNFDHVLFLTTVVILIGVLSMGAVV